MIGGVKVMPDKRKLEEIDRHIAEWRTLVVTQKKRIAELAESRSQRCRKHYSLTRA